MILHITQLGEIEISAAKSAESGDIEISSNTNFAELKRKTHFPITSAYLIEDDEEWSLVVKRNVPEDFRDEFEEYCVFQIENQSEIHKLKAFL